MANIPSLESIFNSLRNKLRDVLNDPKAIVSPGLPVTDLGVIVPFNELERLYLIVEFLNRTSTPTSFLGLIDDTDFLDRFKSYFNLTDVQLNGLLINEAERLFYPFSAIRGSKAYIEIELILTSNSVTFSHGSSLYPKTIFYVGGKAFEMVRGATSGSELVTLSGQNNTNRVRLVVVSTEKTVLAVTAGSAVSVVGYGSDSVISGTVVSVLSYGSSDETIREFLTRVASYYNSGFLDSIGIISSIIAREGFRSKIFKFGEYGFSPRGYGVDVWVDVPYFPVERGGVLIGPPPYYPCNIPSANGPLPNTFPYHGSIFHVEEGIAYFNPIIGHLQSIIYDYSFFGTTPRDHILIRMMRPIFINRIEIGETVFRSGADIPRAKARINNAITNKIKNLGVGEHLDFSDVNAIIYSDPDVDYSYGVLAFYASNVPDGTDVVITSTSGKRGVLSDELSRIMVGTSFTIVWPGS